MTQGQKANRAHRNAVVRKKLPWRENVVANVPNAKCPILQNVLSAKDSNSEESLERNVS